MILFVLFATATPADASDSGPRPVVESFQAGLLQVMREAKTLGVKGRYDRLSPLIDDSFHLRTMVRIACGPYWKQADDSQQEALVTAFKRMSTSTLATLFDGYGGQEFRTVGERDAGHGTVLVDTQLVDPDGSTVSISYVSIHGRDRWWVVDVIVDDGISELKVRISEYRAVLKKGGPAALIDLLNAKADQLIRK
ncbi:MAG: ABC transporter substrate-binding protein [Hyphomicrobiales bacterium]|nr:ABC transporter substrate-binding protein [Hyphomicrobiales bacterium]